MGAQTISGDERPKSQIRKLPRLPKNARVQKRPILRPVIASPYAGADKPKVIYVSTKTPFISTVKRVRKLLNQIDKRSMGKVSLINNKMKDKQRLRQLFESANPASGKEPEEVVLKATNRAIQNVLGLALYFQGQDDCRIEIKTGTVGVVDDIIVDDTATNDDGAESPGDGDDCEDLPESRIRKATVVEVAITLR